MSQQVTVYVVDNDRATRDVLEVSLAVAGYAVESFSSCRKFIEKFQPAEKSCLILDVNLQDMGPTEPVSFLEQCGVHLPIVWLADRGEPALQTQRSVAGALALLEKPLDPDLVLRTIESMLARTADTAGARLSA